MRLKKILYICSMSLLVNVSYASEDIFAGVYYSSPSNMGGASFQAAFKSSNILDHKHSTTPITTMACSVENYTYKGDHKIYTLYFKVIPKTNLVIIHANRACVELGFPWVFGSGEVKSYPQAGGYTSQNWKFYLNELDFKNNVANYALSCVHTLSSGWCGGLKV